MPPEVLTVNYIYYRFWHWWKKKLERIEVYSSQFGVPCFGYCWTVFNSVIYYFVYFSVWRGCFVPIFPYPADLNIHDLSIIIMPIHSSSISFRCSGKLVFFLAVSWNLEKERKIIKKKQIITVWFLWNLLLYFRSSLLLLKMSVPILFCETYNIRYIYAFCK